MLQNRRTRCLRPSELPRWCTPWNPAAPKSIGRSRFLHPRYWQCCCTPPSPPVSYCSDFYKRQTSQLSNFVVVFFFFQFSYCRSPPPKLLAVFRRIVQFTKLSIVPSKFTPALFQIPLSNSTERKKKSSYPIVAMLSSMVESSKKTKELSPITPPPFGAVFPATEIPIPVVIPPILSPPADSVALFAIT